MLYNLNPKKKKKKTWLLLIIFHWKAKSNAVKVLLFGGAHCRYVILKAVVIAIASGIETSPKVEGLCG